LTDVQADEDWGIEDDVPGEFEEDEEPEEAEVSGSGEHGSEG
jgi:hypothetical protein